LESPGAGNGDREPIWEVGEFRSFTEVTLSPAAAVLSYGLGVFEGLRAQRAADDRILLFRPAAHARRFQRSAESLLMQPFPAHQFESAVRELVRRNVRWLPPAGAGTLYLRPIQAAVEPMLGVRRSGQWLVIMLASPVGPYFSGREGLRLKVLERGRCAPGMGSAKAAANYAGALAVVDAWRQRGFDDVLFTDSENPGLMTETSGANLFVRLQTGVVVTPPLDANLFPGVTRDSVLHIASELLAAPVEERPVSLVEIVEQAEEVFCTGTAWGVMSVSELQHAGGTVRLTSQVTCRKIAELLQNIQTGRLEDPFGWVETLRVAS
jgi:branched-chain amino acid aminotransferase